MTYVGFLLGAMAADYYPRLTEVIHDKVAAVRLMNDQAQLGLAIGGPVLLLLIGLAPWVIILFYSKEFCSRRYTDTVANPRKRVQNCRLVTWVCACCSWEVDGFLVQPVSMEFYIFADHMARSDIAWHCYYRPGLRCSPMG